MDGWFMVGAAAVALGLVLLWLGRESRTREPQYWDDGSVVLPCDAHRSAWLCGFLSIGAGVFSFLLGNQPSVSPIDWLLFALWCLLLLLSALRLLATSRISASFTPAGISLQHPLWSVAIPWSDFKRLEPGPYLTARLVVTPSDAVSVHAPWPLRERATGQVLSGGVRRRSHEAVR